MKVAIQNHYEFITRDGYLFKNENSDIGHNLLRPWMELYNLCRVTIEMQSICRTNGIELYTLDQVDPKELDLVIYMDRPRVEPEIGNARKILILYEPDIILPDNWDTAYHDQFTKVLTWDDRLAGKGIYEKHNFTVDWESRQRCHISHSEFERRKLIAMIQTAKNMQHPNSLYPKRIDAIFWFQRNAMFDFDLYGKGWDIKTFFCAKGSTNNKIQTYNNYRFALTFENCDHAVGYISEKMLDAFVAGVVPVYWGAPNVADHIPRECFIDMRDFGDWEDLYNYLSGISYERYMEYLEAIDAFIRSEAAIQFSNEHEVKQLYRLIEEHK
jgi:hypothetical protein